MGKGAENCSVIFCIELNESGWRDAGGVGVGIALGMSTEQPQARRRTSSLPAL